MNKTYKKITAFLLVFVTLFTIIGPSIAAFFTGKDVKSDTYTLGKIEVELVGDDDLYSVEKLTPNEEYNFTRSVKNIGINDAYVYMAVTIPYDLIYTHDLDGNQETGNENEPMDVQLFTYGANGLAGVNPEWKLVSEGHFDYYDVEEIGDTIKNKADTHGAIRTNMTVTYIYGWVGDNGDTLAKLSADEETTSLFDTMKFVNASDTEISCNIEETAGEIVTQVYAIQCDNVLETEYMTGNNMDGSEVITSVWEVVNNALVRVNDNDLNKFVVYVGEEPVVKPSINSFEEQYGESLTTVNAVSDSALYDELVASGEYYDISKDGNMDVIAGVVPKTSSTYGLRNSANEYTYAIVAKDNTIIMAPEDISSWFAFLKHIKYVILENIDFSQTTNVSNMFYNSPTIEYVSFPSNTTYSNVSNASGMFSGCTNLVDTNVNVFTGVTNATNIFNNCENITEIDLSGWEYIDITWLKWLIEFSSTVETIKISNGAMQTIKQEATTEEYNSLTEVVETVGEVKPVEKIEGEYTQLITGSEINTILKNINNTTPYTKIRFVSDDAIYNQIKALDGYQDLSGEGVSVFVGVIGDTCYIATQSGKTIYAPADSSYMFSNLNWVSTIDVRAIDTTDTTNMSYMFNNCSSLTQLNLCSFDISNCTNIDYMFYGCSNLITIYVGGLWSVEHLSSCYYTFVGCDKVIGQSGSKFPNHAECKQFANYKNGVLTFYNGKNNALVTGANFNALIPTTTTEIYFGNYSNIIPDDGVIDLSINSDNSVVGWLEDAAFYITSADGKPINTAGSMSKMFSGKSAITTIHFDNVDTSATFDMSYLFSGCTNLKSLDISCLNTVRTTSMANMFSGCSSLINLNVNHFDMSNVTNASYMFYSCSSLTFMNLSSFDTSSFTNINYMFYGCTNLTTICVSDLWNVEHLSSCYYTFVGCDKLVGQSGSKFPNHAECKQFANYKNGVLTFYNGTPNTLVGGVVFNNLLPLEATEIYIGKYSSAIPNYGTIDFSVSQNGSIVGWLDGTKFYITSKDGNIINTTISMHEMFKARNNITTIVFDNIDTSNVMYTQHMFNNCSSLKKIDIMCLDTSSVVNMQYMFNNCSSLEAINLSNFNTSRVTDMQYMFSGCTSLTQLDISSFDTRACTNMKYMFYNCANLTTIYVSDLWSVEQLSSCYYTLIGCYKLVGQSGLKYQPVAESKPYANYQTGLLTYKEYVVN